MHILFGELRFGAHKYKHLSDVPTSYLRWMLKGLDSLEDDERRQVEAELNDREIKASFRAGSHRRQQRSQEQRTWPPSQGANLPKGVTPDVILRIISAGRQTLAKRLHPDAGGDVEAMKRVNVAADFLEQQARALAATGTGAPA